MSEPQDETPEAEQDGSGEEVHASEATAQYGVAKDTNYTEDGTLPDAPTYLETAPTPGDDK